MHTASFAGCSWTIAEEVFAPCLIALVVPNFREVLLKKVSHLQASVIICRKRAYTTGQAIAICCDVRGRPWTKAIPPGLIVTQHCGFRNTAVCQFVEIIEKGMPIFRIS